MRNGKIRVNVQGVDLMLARPVPNGAKKACEIALVPFGDTDSLRAQARANTIFPGFRVITRLARQYLGKSAKRDAVRSSPTWNVVYLLVPHGTTVEQRATFLAAVATRCKLKA